MGCAKSSCKHLFGAISDDLQDVSRSDMIEQPMGVKHFRLRISASLETSLKQILRTGPRNHLVSSSCSSSSSSSPW
eukprot:9476824-Pyramimonas_sp.AAC.1